MKSLTPDTKVYIVKKFRKTGLIEGKKKFGILILLNVTIVSGPFETVTLKISLKVLSTQY